MWPRINDKAGAKSVAQWGFVASLLQFVLIAFGGLIGRYYGGLFDAALFLVAAIFIRRMSRAWSVFALVLYLTEMGLAIRNSQNAINLETLLVLYGFANGIRGTFAYHQFLKTAQNEPSS